MKLNTKYNFKDKVWLIKKKENTIIMYCSFCGGTGIITGVDDSQDGVVWCYNMDAAQFFKACEGL